MKKHFTAHIIFAATTLASQQVWALGFGRAVSDAVLGQAFTFTVPVRVDPGERFGTDCVIAEVYYGEVRLQSSGVRTEIERGTSDNEWRVRITAAAPVGEPIVEVALDAGCERRFTRRFTVFADPPTTGTTAARLPQVAAGSQVPAAATTTDAAPAASGRARRPEGRSAAGGAPPARPRAVRKGPTMALARELDASPAVASPRHDADARNARKPGPRVAAAATAGAARLVLDSGYAHLKLDLDDPVIPASAGASGAAIGLSELDDPDARQLRQLEQGIQAVKRDSQASREQVARLQAQLAAAQSRNDWLPWLFGLLAIALAAAAALAWKLRRQSMRRQGAWFDEAPLSGAPTPPPAPGVAPLPALTAAPLPRAAGPSTDDEPEVEPPLEETADARAGVVSDVSATRPLDRHALAGATAQETAVPRELSVEELLDLEQQADFFIALGQEDAAVDLLMSHLRSAGGQSPLPYTKLLEIYRRQGDRSAYERTRARFNRRFNAYAPDWDTGPSAGRSLEDYPETVALLQGAWSSPIDAMAVLEGLLFKRDDTSELFDLPAYRDVLVLYSLARDLWQQGGGNPGTQVDVLLPLDDADAAAFQPGAYSRARDFNDADRPRDADAGVLTSFEMTGYGAGGAGATLDLEIADDAAFDGGDTGFDARDPGVHATLDALSLAPIAPSKRKPPSPDWDDSAAAPDSGSPTKR